LLYEILIYISLLILFSSFLILFNSRLFRSFSLWYFC